MDRGKPIARRRAIDRGDAGQGNLRSARLSDDGRGGAIIAAGGIIAG
jgi:hypothetical protein